MFCKGVGVAPGNPGLVGGHHRTETESEVLWAMNDYENRAREIAFWAAIVATW